VEPYTIVTGADITQQMISDAIELDRISYEEKYQLQIDTCISYYKRNNDIYIMAQENESCKVVGYINFSPVKKSVFLDLLSGNAIDTIISGDDILPYIDNTLYHGYFSSIVVHPLYRQQGIATKMLHVWSELIVNLAVNRDIFFHNIVADAVSDIGEHLLSEIGFSCIHKSSHSSKIMTLNLFSPDIGQTKLNKEILPIYQNYMKRRSTCNEIQ